jgi:hypothetical protein
VTRHSSSITCTGKRVAATILISAASERVIQAGTANGLPSGSRTTK